MDSTEASEFLPIQVDLDERDDIEEETKSITLSPSPALSSLSTYRITGLPPTAYYVADFLTPKEAATLYTHLTSLPTTHWTALTHRRLQPHPAPLTPTGHLLTTKTLPSHLHDPIIPRLLALCAQNSEIWTNSPHGRPNHCLVNEYRPGQGISKHQDGAAYWGVVATVSLGGCVVLEIGEKREKVEDGKEGKGGGDGEYRILQEHGSLLITTDEIYTNHLHGISSITVDEDVTSSTIANWSLLRPETRSRIDQDGGKVVRTTRISLTYRDVIKVKDANRLFGGRRV